MPSTTSRRASKSSPARGASGCGPHPRTVNLKKASGYWSARGGPPVPGHWRGYSRPQRLRGAVDLDRRTRQIRANPKRVGRSRVARDHTGAYVSGSSKISPREAIPHAHRGAPMTKKQIKARAGYSSRAQGRLLIARFRPPAWPAPTGRRRKAAPAGRAGRLSPRRVRQALSIRRVQTGPRRLLFQMPCPCPRSDGFASGARA